MTDTFREYLATNWNIVGTPTTDTGILRLAQHPTRRRGEVLDEHQQQHHHQTKNQHQTSTSRTSKPVAYQLRRPHQQQHQQQHHRQMICPRARGRTMPTKERTSHSYSRPHLPAQAMVLWLALAACLLLGQLVSGEDSQANQKQQADPRSTQPTLDRQLESPSSSSSSGPSSATVASGGAAAKPASSDSNNRQQHESPAPVRSSPKPQKPAASLASQKRAAALAAQRDYDKYQLKASSSTSPARVAADSAAATTAAAAATASDLQKQQQAADKDQEKEKANNNNNNNGSSNNNKQEASSALEPAHKKVGQLPNTRPHPKASAFSLLRKFLPSFMTSAAAAAAASAVADKQPHGNHHHHQNQHSRSSPGTSGSLLSSLLSSAGASSLSGGGGSSSSVGQQQSSALGSVGESSGSPLTGKIINLLTGAQKKKGLPEGVSSAIPNHAPFFMRKSATDRQAAGGGALALASGLLSNPLKLGLLFSAPLLPSLLLTPLAIAGLSPAMSAINNFFGDDDEPSTSSSSQSPLSALASGSSSPWASILQATGASPFASASSSSSGSSANSDSSSSSSGSGSGSSSGVGNSLALQAFQSFVLGPTSTTERPLFKPGMFASSSGIQNAAGAISSAISSASQQSSSSNNNNNNNQRPFFGSGGGLMQAAASMISPSFAAPPSSSSSGSTNSNNDDDDRGLIQMASDVFEKVANYMGNDNTKDGQAIAQASGAGSATNSPALSALASLSSMSPFQLSSLFPSSLGQASGGSTGSSSSTGSASSAVGNKNQRVGFFSTLRNVYELFSSSFLRRQEVGNENECQQRLVCELHQRAMNSKMFRRSLQTSLTELANLDKNLLEQIKYGTQAIQARVDPDTKAMLNDFLKATNNFKSGREMINCSQMFPKCTRTQLLAAANAHLADPVNGRAIGKFSQLMKKMKFKANQQSTSQWKLRKPGKSSNVNQASMMAGASQMTPMGQPIDNMQVVPLQSQSIQNAGGQFTPADSLKLAQQIMLLSQMSQQQPQQQQQWSGRESSGQPMPPVNYPQSQPSPMVQQQQPSYSASSFTAPAQYSPAPKQQTTYTDAMLPTVYSSPTDSPYFMPQLGVNMGSQQQQQQPQQQQQQQYMSNGQFVESSQQQVAQAIGTNQQQSNGNNNNQQQAPGSYQSAAPSDQSMPQQQQPSRGLNMDNKNKPQQLMASNKLAAIPA